MHQSGEIPRPLSTYDFFPVPHFSLSRSPQTFFSKESVQQSVERIREKLEEVKKIEGYRQIEEVGVVLGLLSTFLDASRGKTFHEEESAEVYFLLCDILPLIDFNKFEHMSRVTSLKNFILEMFTSPRGEQRLAICWGEMYFKSVDKKEDPFEWASYSRYVEVMWHYAKALEIGKCYKLHDADHEIHVRISKVFLVFIRKSLPKVKEEQMKLLIGKIDYEGILKLSERLALARPFFCDSDDLFQFDRDYTNAIAKVLPDIQDVSLRKKISSHIFPSKEAENRQELPSRTYRAKLHEFRKNFQNKAEEIYNKRFKGNSVFNVDELRQFQNKLREEGGGFFLHTFLLNAFVILGLPPCGWSAEMMGSRGRGDFGPNADLEWYFTIEDKKNDQTNKHNIAYFKKVARLVNLLVISLGESPFDSASTFPSHPNHIGFHLDADGNPSNDNEKSIVLQPLTSLLSKYLDDEELLREASLCFSKTICSQNLSKEMPIFDKPQIRKLKAIKLLKKRLSDYQEIEDTYINLSTLDLKKYFQAPLIYLLRDIGLYFGITELNPLQLIPELEKRQIFSNETRKFLEQTLGDFYLLRLKKEFSTDASFCSDPQFIDCLEKLYWLGIRPLYRHLKAFIDSKSKQLEDFFKELNLPADALLKEPFDSLEIDAFEPLIKHLVQYLISTIKVSFDDFSDHTKLHVCYYKHLSQNPELEPLRSAYVRTLESLYAIPPEMLIGRNGDRFIPLERRTVANTNLFQIIGVQDREDLVAALISLESDKRSRKLLYKEIYLTVISFTHADSPFHKKWHKKALKLDQLQREWDTLIEHVKESIVLTTPFPTKKSGLIKIVKKHPEGKDWVDKLEKKSKALKKEEKAVKKFFSGKKIYRQYINFFLNEQVPLTLGLPSSLLYCKAKHKSLFVWELNEENGLTLVSKTIDERPMDIIHLLKRGHSQVELLSEKSTEFLNDSNLIKLHAKLLEIPNTVGVRQIHQVNKRKLQADFLAHTTVVDTEDPSAACIYSSFAPQGRSLPKHLMDELLENSSILIGPSLELRKQDYKSLLVEYAIHNLTSRIAGHVTPPAELAHIRYGDREFPVLILRSIQGENAEQFFLTNPDNEERQLQKIDRDSLTWHYLCEILTLPGSKGFANYVIETETNRLYSHNNRNSFIDPVDENPKARFICFASALFSLKPQKLSLKVLKKFSQLDPYKIIYAWSDEISKIDDDFGKVEDKRLKDETKERFKEEKILRKEEQKRRESELYPLFGKGEKEKEKELEKPKKKTEFKGTQFIPGGAVPTFIIQFNYLKDQIKKWLKEKKLVSSMDLLNCLILVSNGQTIHLPYIKQQYEKTFFLDLRDRLFAIDGKKIKQSSHWDYKITTPVSPVQRRIVRNPRSIQEAKKELVYYNEPTDNLRHGNGSLSAEFDVIEEVDENRIQEEETKLTLALRICQETKKPLRITIKNSSQLSCNHLKGILHAKLQYLNLSGSALDAYGIKLIQDKCPDLRELYLNDCKKLIAIEQPEVYSTGYRHINLPELEVLEVQRCDHLQCLRVRAPNLKFLKIDNNPLIRRIELWPLNLYERGSFVGVPAKKLKAEIYQNLIALANQVGVVNPAVIKAYQELSFPTFFQLKKLTLSSQVLNTSEIKWISNGIAYHHGLQEFDFSFNTTSSEDTGTLCEGLNQNSSIQVLNFNTASIDQKGCTALKNLVARTTVLASLTLFDCYLGTNGLNIIIKGLYNNKSLTFLELSSQPISEKDTEELCRALAQNTTLTQLKLNKASINSTGAHSIANFLRTNSSITELHLDSNPLEDDGVESLITALETNQSIRSLSVTSGTISRRKMHELRDIMKERQKKKW